MPNIIPRSTDFALSLIQISVLLSQMFDASFFIVWRKALKAHD